MTPTELDPVIHAPHRLRICAIAHSASYVEFGELQKRLGLSKSALSKHLTQLVEHGYIEEERLTRAGRSRLRISLTETGRQAYQEYVSALEAIINGTEEQVTRLKMVEQ